MGQLVRCLKYDTLFWAPSSSKVEVLDGTASVFLTGQSSVLTGCWLTPHFLAQIFPLVNAKRGSYYMAVFTIIPSSGGAPIR